MIFPTLQSVSNMSPGILRDRRKMTYEMIAIGELIGDGLEILSERAARARITVAMKVLKEPLFMSFDKRAFKQILLNPLTHSVKFTLAGDSVTVIAGTVDGGVEVAVVDTGVGIAPDQLPTITEFSKRVRQI
jgi:signal transduction histidine kinase